MELLNAAKRLELKCKIVEEKVRTLVPRFMREYGTEMWIVSGEDALMKVLLKEPTNNNTTLIFVNVNGEFACYQNLRHPGAGNDLYSTFLEKDEKVIDGLKRLIADKKPQNIALNMSREFSELSGASVTLYEDVKSICGDVPIINAELMAMDISQTRTQDELDVYEVAAQFARELITYVMSSDFVTPGATTNLDLRDYMLQKYQENGLIRTWGPNVDMQRCGVQSPMIGMGDTKEIIEKGDLLHIDFGFEYIGLHTDMQYLAYVRKDGEETAPVSLENGFKQCYEFQKIYMETVKVGMTGNEARAEILEKAEKSGMEAMVYSHPIGHSVHSVGPSIGRFGAPVDTPHGVYTIKDNSCFAMEQNVRVVVPEWNEQKVFIFREEDVAIINGKVQVIGELQKELLLI